MGPIPCNLHYVDIYTVLPSIFPLGGLQVLGQEPSLWTSGSPSVLPGPAALASPGNL